MINTGTTAEKLKKMSWNIELVGKKPQLNSPIFIAGLPGIGNVGKVAVDFMIDDLKAKKLYRITSFSMPHSVFVNEKNLVELPRIEIYYKQFNNPKKADLLLLAGDFQPIDEVSSYEFSHKVLDLAKEYNSQEIITLGGIGLLSAPKKPKVYCTANSKDIIKKYKEGTKINDNLYGVVGPIVGVAGLLLGLAEQRKIKAISFLAETMGHPMYLGVKGAREILEVLNKKLELGIDIKELDDEVNEIEEELMKKVSEIDAGKKSKLGKMKRGLGSDCTYIG